MQTFTIHIENLTFKTIIGLLDFEREKKQKVVLHVEIDYVLGDNFIDYAQVVQTIKKTVKKEKFLLIEDALIHLDKKLRKKYKNIKNIKIKLQKPDILQDCDVGVSYKS